VHNARARSHARTHTHTHTHTHTRARAYVRTYVTEMKENGTNERIGRGSATLFDTPISTGYFSKLQLVVRFHSLHPRVCIDNLNEIRSVFTHCFLYFLTLIFRNTTCFWKIKRGNTRSSVWRWILFHLNGCLLPSVRTGWHILVISHVSSWRGQEHLCLFATASATHRVSHGVFRWKLSDSEIVVYPCLP
jgi:hypothetical protein